MVARPTMIVAAMIAASAPAGATASPLSSLAKPWLTATLASGTGDDDVLVLYGVDAHS